MDKLISVREAVKFGSVAGGQGYKACNCKTGKCVVRELDVVVSKMEQNVILDVVKVMIIKIAQ
jgi:hypothetical protein